MSGARDREFGSLLEAIGWLEGWERWESIPAADRERAVEALAKMLLRAVEAEDEGQGEDSCETPVPAGRLRSPWLRFRTSWDGETTLQRRNLK